IKVAALTDREAVIAEGLAEGEIVAVDGNFLLDSQSQLAGNPSLLDPSRAPTAPKSIPTDEDPFEGMEVQVLDFE
ncbi:MAG: hypothetical protein AAGG44_11795, partial [Planctomycetota bacterium]